MNPTEAVKKPAKSDDGYYILRVKRKRSEKPSDTLILDSVKLTEKKKMLRILPPEDYLQEELGILKLDESGKKQRPMLFEKISELTEEFKKAEKVKVDIDSQCELFKLNTKKEKNENRIDAMRIKIEHKNKLKQLQVDTLKDKRNELIKSKRKDGIEKAHQGSFWANNLEKIRKRIKELKEKDDRVEFLRCNEKLLTSEY